MRTIIDDGFFMPFLGRMEAYMRKEVLNETKFIQEIVAVLPIVICFQSLILDMAGNVGTLVPMFFHKRLWHPDR